MSKERVSYVGKGFRAKLEVPTNSVTLFFGEAEVINWPVERGRFDDLVSRNHSGGVQWRVDQYVSERLAELFGRVQTAMDEDII